ncbi:hypothetical protein ACFL6S_07245 [Candidatus Poribacteria bacterium]
MVVAILIVVIYILPIVWGGIERFDPSTGYRLPYILSNDYWMFTRWSKYATSEYPALIIGDSVVWGQYVSMEQTLPHYLNERVGENMFANMGVDGMHPAAILGLIEHYGKAISDRSVILHLNPLWMSSEKHDLSGEDEFRFNHPRLVPQFMRKPACYKPPLSQRIGVLAERNISFFSWMNHIKTNYFENLDLQNWTMENPYENPMKALTLEVPKPENRPKSRPIAWFERDMKRQDFPWLEAEESYQWHSFRKALKILKARKNSIFVTLGPFNPYILTEESLSRYNDMKKEMERWLEEEGIDYISLSDLPSEYYADASHPLKEGYAMIAEELLGTDSFRKWIRRYRNEDR